jgi:cellulose synthase operon protein B
MKQLFILSKNSTKTIVFTFCFLLFPVVEFSAEAQNKIQFIEGSQSPEELSTQSNLTEIESTEATKVTSRSRLKQRTTAVLEEEDSKTLGSSQYVMEFNRSPVVGNRMRLRGNYSEGRLGFTRPRDWKIGKVQTLIRFQHSPILYANRSNLTILVNDTSIGSIPLNRKDSQVGQALVNIPTKLLQEYNEIKIVAQQNSSPQCNESNDPNLWTEILPDSKIIFNFARQPVASNLNRFPYPIFDNLSLETNSVVYLQPSQVNANWLQSTARFQATLGRAADFRPMETSLVSNLTKVKPNQKLVIIGTPSEQPELASLKLPIKISNNKIVDGNLNPISEDRGMLVMTTIQKGSIPVLIATGNNPKAVAKAVQLLVQNGGRKMTTGQVIPVDKLAETLTPGARQWPNYLPENNSFKLSDLQTQVKNEPFKDVTVRGGSATGIEIDFRALPDDRFIRGSSMNLVYSYGPQMNPRTSAVEVLLDDVFIGGARLDKDGGDNRKNLKVNLPENLVKPDSKLKVFFRMNPREPFDKQACIHPPQEQLNGTLHSDTSFDLKRENSVQLPDLKLLQHGYPFAAPQDLSQTAIVLPKNPSNTDVMTLLTFSERLGRLSKAESVKLDVYTPDSLPETVRQTHNLVGIGTKDKFPFPEVFKSNGLNLSQAFGRNSGDGTSIQTLPDSDGFIKEILSPSNNDRVLLALTSQTEVGLERVRQILLKDPWFFKLKQDTVLISSDKKDPLSYESEAYEMKFLQSTPNSKRVENTSILSKTVRLLQENWLLLPIGIIGMSLLLYGTVQLYIKRIAIDERK